MNLKIERFILGFKAESLILKLFLYPSPASIKSDRGRENTMELIRSLRRKVCYNLVLKSQKKA